MQKYPKKTQKTKQKIKPHQTTKPPQATPPSPPNLKKYDCD